MKWVLVIAAAVISDSLRIFIDNYVSDVYFKENGAVAQKIASGLAYPIIGIIVLAINNFDIASVSPFTLGLLIASGILGSIAGIPYFKALEIDDSTNIGIFFQFSPILYLILGWTISNESFAITQLIGSLIILAAPALIIITARKRSRKVRLRAAALAFLAIAFYVLSGETFVLADTTNLGLFNEVSLILIAKGFTDLIIIGGRHKWRHRLTTVIKTSHHKVLLPVSASIILHSIQEFTYRIGLIIAPTIAIASAASDSVEPIVIFFMGLVLTLIWPQFGREKLQKKVVLVHLIATVLVATGIIILQI